MDIPKLHIILPVKDSIETAREAILHVVESESDVDRKIMIYNDFSSDETTAELESLSSKYNINLINISELTSHPSPNYLLVLRHAQENAKKENAHLVIVESDVLIRKDSFRKLGELSRELVDAALIAAITVDERGKVNFPYLYARRFKEGVVKTHKRLSFCCTLLTNRFLNAYDFKNLDPDKSWFDVFISHKATEIGFSNYLVTSHRVVHKPHSSRPWKKLKYSNPLKYYWQKIIKHRDRI